MPHPLGPRRRQPRRLYLGVGLLALLALAMYFLFDDHGYFALRREQKRVERLEQEIMRLQEENRRLAEEIDALKNDPAAIERAARERLKMARPGEKVIILPAEQPPGESDSPGEKEP